MTNTCIFTIIAPNYLGQALTLKNSIEKFSSSIDFKIVVVTDEKIDYDLDISSIVINPNDIGIDNYQNLCFSYNILEHCTNIKPACFKYLLATYEYIYYIDPDIYFYQDPRYLSDLFEGNDILLTPHALSPILDSYKPTELEFLRTGTFNLGFIGIKRSSRVIDFLNWWASRCEHFGINETNSGLFVDQKWMDLAPCFFDFIQITRHRGVNVGYWNLHEREISIKKGNYYSGDDILIFFHFSGLDPYNIENISKHQSRKLLEKGTVIFDLFKEYASKLISYSENKYKGVVPFCTFSNGYRVTELARKYFWKNTAKYDNIDLFSSHSDLYRDCKKNGLLAKTNSTSISFGSQSDLKSFSLHINLIEISLNAVKFLLGPVRFILLKKYLLQRFSILSDFYKW